MKTTGDRKLSVAVMLCITANGNKLPPYMTLKQKDIAKRKYLQKCNSMGPKNAWMASELMEDWLGCVWECLSGALSVPQSLLAMDAYHGHFSDIIRIG
jgi:hypothetical protein